MTTLGLREFLASRVEGDLLPWRCQLEACERFGLSPSAVELAVLEAGFLPTRYRRNRITLSIEDQLRVFQSRVAIIGCGGLGGYLVEELARLGVGTLVLVDPDVFEEHNLNRQLLSSVARLGSAKVQAGRDRVAEINPAVTIAAHQVSLGVANGRTLLSGCSAVVDGLDNVLVRRELATLCRDLGLPLVHGAIAGWYGQVTVQMPGGDITPWLRASPEGKGVETKLGNPSYTPAVIASLQVAELVKVLLRRGKSLAGRVLFVDLLNMKFEELGSAESPRS